MADSGIKKYRQSYSNLPPINTNTQGYSIRYRIVSDDRNRSSHWSPVYLIVPNYTYVPGLSKMSSSNQIVNFSWDPVVVLKSKESKNDITNKVLSNNIVTLTTSSPHYMKVNDWVTVSNVGVPFNGTYKITSITNNTFSYYKNNTNIGSSAVSPSGTRKTNSVVSYASEYDIWLKWDRNDGGVFEYKERVSTTSISYPHAEFYTVNGIVQPQAPNRVSIEIYLVGSPVARASFLKVYEILNQTI